jgi:type I restriction enzyme R subunit
MGEQEFENFKSKYLDLYDKVKQEHAKEKVSILDDVDFELELIHRDEINVTYIIQLLIKLKAEKKGDSEKTKQEIANLLSTETTLRSKRELIERFIEENLPLITDTDEVTNEFDKFWDKEQRQAFEKLIKEENLSKEKTEKLIEDYLFAEREPLTDDLLDLIAGEKPSILQRKKRRDGILLRIKEFVETFINGMVG